MSHADDEELSPGFGPFIVWCLVAAVVLLALTVAVLGYGVDADAAP
jgi:hypothetical protein